MDIRLNNALNSYSVTGKMNLAGVKKSDTSRTEKAKSESKSDSVSFSSDALKNSGIYKLNSSIRAELDSLSGSDRVALIKDAVSNGSYNVPADDVAGAILDRFV